MNANLYNYEGSFPITIGMLYTNVYTVHDIIVRQNRLLICTKKPINAVSKLLKNKLDAHWKLLCALLELKFQSITKSLEY